MRCIQPKFKIIFYKRKVVYFIQIIFPSCTWKLSVTKFDFLNLRKHSWKTFCPSQKFVYSSTTFCTLPGHANWDEDVAKAYEPKLTQQMNYLISHVRCTPIYTITLDLCPKHQIPHKNVVLVLDPSSCWPITWIKDWLIAPILILPSPISLPPAEIQAVEGGRPFRHHRIWSTFDPRFFTRGSGLESSREYLRINMWQGSWRF